LYPANKKVGRYASSDFRTLDEPANFTVLGGRLRSWLEPVKLKQTVLIQGKNRGLGMKNRNHGREVGWLTYLLAAVLVLYFIFVRSRMG
jgi:hypothetical protein